MGLLVVVGLVGQSFQAVRGAWAIGESREPPSWPVVSEDGSRGPFRVLWLGREGGAEFPAPGGLPEQQVRDGAHSVRLSVTGRDGASAFDIARPGEGDGYAYIRASLREAISGTSRHLGALLAPAGIRYVVAGDGDLPAGIRDRLDGQVDLDLIQSAGGLVIFRNARSFPPQAVIGEPEWFQTAVRGDEVLLHAALAPHPRAVPLSGGGSRFEGSAEPGQAAYLADQGRDWRNRSEQGDLAVPRTAFGWAMAFPVERSGPVVLEFAGQWLRRLELVVLALLWGIALWVTRRVPKAPRP
jgi:hypothetical protein